MASAPAEATPAAEAPEAPEAATASEEPAPVAAPIVAETPPAPVLTATTAPPPPAAKGPHLDSRAEPLLAAGLGGFGTLYLLTAYAGAHAIDKARDMSHGDYGDDNEGQMTRNRGRALLIPVAGPFIGMHFTNSARRKYWLAINGSLQASTLVMGIIGARMFAKHRRAKRRAQLTAAAGPDGAQLGMAMRF